MSGFTVVSSNTMHIVRGDPRPDGDREKLVAHEGTHILIYRSWGSAGTPMMGEGSAVWASGAYGGVSLD